MKGCVNITLSLLVARLHKTENYTSETKNLLAQLIQILKEYNYPLIELADILSIVLMLEYILSDDKLIKTHKDFIDSSIDTIEYILSEKTYLKIEERIIFLEYEFYTNICENPKEFEDEFTEELKKLIMNSKKTRK